MISDDKLIELYNNQKLSIKEIARETHTDRKTICKQLTKLNIPIENRSYRKAAKLKEFWSNMSKDDKHLHGYRVKKGLSRGYRGVVGVEDTIDYDIEHGEFIKQDGSRIDKKYL